MSVPTRPNAPRSSTAEPAARRGGCRRAAPGRHRTRSTSATREDSVKTITRSPACSTSSLCGKIALPSRTIAPISGAADRHLPERAGPTYSLDGARRDVEHLEAIALEHRDLLRAGVVGEADDLLGRHLARVDGHVDSRVLVDLAGDRVVDDRDRERRRRAPARASPRSGSSRPRASRRRRPGSGRCARARGTPGRGRSPGRPAPPGSSSAIRRARSRFGSIRRTPMPCSTS